MIVSEGDEKGLGVSKLMVVICLCVAIFPVCGQAKPRYEVATILDVQVHEDAPSDVVRYDISLKVGHTIYVVLYTPAVAGGVLVKYAAGRELLVLVGEKAITYNDMMGQSWQVPIESQRSTTRAK